MKLEGEGGKGRMEVEVEEDGVGEKDILNHDDLSHSKYKISFHSSHLICKNENEKKNIYYLYFYMLSLI